MHRLALLTLLVALPATASERVTDSDLRQLFQRLNHHGDRFEDQLDGKLKREVLRGPHGEVAVSRYVDELQENVGRLKDRFSASYPASAEATSVLQQATVIHAFLASQPANLKGASEWNRLAAGLGELAAAYGTVFPLPVGTTARRINDLEVQQTAEVIRKAATRFERALDESLKMDHVIAPASRESALEAIETVRKTAAVLASRVGDGHPASGEAQALFNAAAAVESLAAARPQSRAAQIPWTAVRGGLDKLAQAFGLAFSAVP